MTIYIILFILFSVLLYLVIFILPKFKLISGFVAKNMASSVFLAQRSPQSTQEVDNGAPFTRLGKTQVDLQNKSVIATVFGLYKSIATYKEGLGAMLVHNSSLPKIFTPNRNFTSISKPYPHGHLPPEKLKSPNANVQKIKQTIQQVLTKGHSQEIKNTRAIVILHKGQLLAEQYAKGFDEHSLLQSWSITKSVFTSCFGVLQKQGFDIFKPIKDFDVWKHTQKKKVSAHHLLQMQSGIKWEEHYQKISDVTKMLFKDEDCTYRCLKNPLVFPPGTKFNYGGGDTNLLSALLRRQCKTHQEYLDFPYRYLIDKIGMHSLCLETDSCGNYIASTYSWATARDWAKFGQLFLQNGMWNGEQILDKDWVQYIRTPASASALEYGGQWWLNKGKFMPNVPEDCFYADGFQGQRIFVIPSKDLVVVRFGVTHLEREEFYPIFDRLLGGICELLI